MSITPKKYTYEELQKLRKGTDDVNYFVFPGNDNFRIAVRPLSQSEIMTCISEGRRKCDAEVFKPTSSDYNDYQTYELLYRSIMQAEDHEINFFPSPEAVSNEFSENLAYLTQYYNEVQSLHTPEKDINTEAEFNVLIENVKKNSPLGMSLSSHMLRKLLLFMIRECEKLQKDNGSSSLPLNKNEENTSDKSSEQPHQEINTMVEVSTKIES